MGWRFWESPEPVVLPAPQLEPVRAQEPLFVEEVSDDGLTDLQREMRAFGACELEYKWPSQIAQEWVNYQRLNGFCDYPYMSCDIDKEVAIFCERQGYIPQPPQIMREAISAIPGVGPPIRARLSKSNPKHRFIIQRLAAMKSSNDRPYLYYISPSVPASAYGQQRPWYDQDGTTEDAAPPVRAKAKKRTTRPKGGRDAPQHGPEHVPTQDYPDASWEVPPQRRYA